MSLSREEIIRIAKEAAIYDLLADEVIKYGELELFAELIAAAEREGCAKVCDGWTGADGDKCAEAILARGNGGVK